MSNHNRAADGLIWANLIHLSYNMWCDRPYEGSPPHIVAQPYLRFDEGLWSEIVVAMVEAGITMVVLDLGDAVRYQSCPEIAVEGAWSPNKLRTELRRLRKLGLEPIPKLNFSTAHDTWLGSYARMVSTETYYHVCSALIREVCDLFDRPRFFHLGMDEETAEHQRNYEYAVMRQHGLWWNDLLQFVSEVEACGSRAWIWSDHVWHHPADFYRLMPRSVVQSNWYYDASFDAERTHPEPRPYPYSKAFLAYLDLDDNGFEQIPTGSNWSCSDNFAGTVAYCLERLNPQRLLGFLQTPWRPTLPEFREHHLAAIEQVAAARRAIDA